MLLGIVSDTHGYAGDDILAALAGCDHIVHAGDVGEGVLALLAGVAPVTAVRGNNDLVGEAAVLPLIVRFQAGGRRITVVHELRDAPADGWDVLIFGHCHRRHADVEGALLRLNPGAAGRRGFHRTRTIARLDTASAQLDPVFVDLGPRGAAR
jgi:hypothetical protein